MPRLSYSLAIALGCLLAAPPHATHCAQAIPPRMQNRIPVHATLSYSGRPSYVALRLPGRLLAEHRDLPEGSYECSFTIPEQVRSLEILIEMRWPAMTTANQKHRVILALTPEEQNPLAQTAVSRGASLHDLLVFVW